MLSDYNPNHIHTGAQKRISIVNRIFVAKDFVSLLDVNSIRFKSSPRGSSVYVKYRFNGKKISRALYSTEFGGKPRTHVGLLEEILAYGLNGLASFMPISTAISKALDERHYESSIDYDAKFAAAKLAKLVKAPDLLGPYDKIDRGTRVEKRKDNLIKLAKVRIKKSLTEAILDGLSMEDIETIANESLVEVLMRS